VQDRTEQAMDTSSHIKAIISGICTYEDSDEIIGEIQFCYLTGMLIGNAACMEHWVKTLISGLTLYSHFFMRTKNRSRVSELSSLKVLGTALIYLAGPRCQDHAEGISTCFGAARLLLQIHPGNPRRVHV
jgi:hypothetical protein